MNEPPESPRPRPAIAPVDRGPDRRRRTTGLWDFLWTPARRSAHRRAQDQALGEIRFVDRHPRPIAAMAIALLVLTLVDGVLTLLLVRSHCAEANPVMAYMLEQGELAFLMSKYILTAGGVGFLICARTYPLFGTRFQVANLLPILVVLYMVLLGYQCYLLAHGPGEIRPIAFGGGGGVIP
ncbi:MAG: DUF5658 family protein [Isosphaeraceae bacterium]